MLPFLFFHSNGYIVYGECGICSFKFCYIDKYISNGFLSNLLYRNILYEKGKKQYGLSFAVNLKRSIFGIALFILLYLLICLLGFVTENIFLGRSEGYAFKPDTPMYLAAMAINLLFSFTVFLVKNMDGDIFCSLFCKRNLD